MISSRYGLLLRRGKALERSGDCRINCVTTRIFGTNYDGRKEKVADLLGEVGRILLNPQLASVGLARTLQVAATVNSVSLDVLRNRSRYAATDRSLPAPKVMRKLFEEFGATYIKLGQFIASSPTVFPAEYVTEFQSCLDKTPPVAYETIRAIIERDLGRSVHSVYAFVDPAPLATASIAQVHRARLLDGTEVVIKVRKPGVDSTLKADLSFLLISSKLLEFINPKLSSISLANIVTDIRDSMLDELDFQKEIANIENFRAFLSKHNITDAVAPRPFLHASSQRVLTMEYLEGVSLTDLERIRMFADSPEETLISALRTWALSVSQNDKFHADLHAGNLLVLRDGRIGFIDFGIVGTISNKFRTSLDDLYQALVKEDFTGVARALVGLGATQRAVSIDRFAEDLRALVRRLSDVQPEVHATTIHYGNTTSPRIDIDEKALTQLVLDTVAVAERHGLRLPREFGMVLKQALYFDRYQKLLAPTLDPLRDARIQEQFHQQVMQSVTLSNTSSTGAHVEKKKKKKIIIDVDVKPEV